LQSKLTSFGKKESSMKEELDNLLSQNNQLTYQCEAHIRDKRSLTGKNETLQSKLNELSSAKNEAERLLKRFGDSLPTLSLHNVASKNKSTESVDRAASKGDAIPTFESKDSRMTSPDSYSYSISSPFDNSTPNVSKAVPIHDLLSKVVIKKNVTTPLSSATPSDSVMSSTKKNKEKSFRSLDDNDEWNINGANVSLNMSSPAVALSKSSTPIEKSKLDALKALYSTASSGIKKK